MEGSSSGLNDVYSVGNVSGLSDTGLFGGIYSGGTINRVYVYGQFSSTLNSPNFIAIASVDEDYVSQAYWAIKSSAIASSVDFSSYFVSQLNYNSSNVNGKTDADMRSQATFQGFNFGSHWSNVWNIDEGSSTPYLRALGKHPVSNINTPAPRQDSALVLNILNNVNYDRNLFGDVFARGVGNTVPTQFEFGRNIPINDPIGTIQMFEQMVTPTQVREIFDRASNGNVQINEVAAGQTDFTVDPSTLNLGDAISIQDLYDTVFKTEVKPAEKRVMMGPAKAKLENVKGDVRVLSKTGDVYVAKEGMELAEGAKAELATKADGGKNVVKMQEKSAVSLDQKPVAEGESMTSTPEDLLKIAFGRVSVIVAAGNGRSTFKVQTPTTVAASRG